MKTFTTECIDQHGTITIYKVENQYSLKTGMNYSIYAENGYEYKITEIETEDMIRINKLIEELF